MGRQTLDQARLAATVFLLYKKFFHKRNAIAVMEILGMSEREEAATFFYGKFRRSPDSSSRFRKTGRRRRHDAA